ncbi:hypothetical protein Srubr_29540 [Streptomyces rubradiris]|uniref:F5/8 type C domain-containing protein n=1 Tax=Streptomyces rubradiris TaxID=285531 RepID=A0ABQ3RB86_STRRR|nr:hypothetical protein GCM10018792_52420 [Streptomyces rubradiris]GHI53108.1 hypothetical protein Srubr_29540 [Streptomyces rubradiris]
MTLTCLLPRRANVTEVGRRPTSCVRGRRSSTCSVVSLDNLPRPPQHSSGLRRLPLPAANAVDGEPDTRWASDWSDHQWIRADLGTRTAFRHVRLLWEASYGKAYAVQTSDDGQTWRTVRTVTDGNGSVDDLDDLDVSRTP